MKTVYYFQIITNRILILHLRLKLIRQPLQKLTGSKRCELQWYTQYYSYRIRNEFYLIDNIPFAFSWYFDILKSKSRIIINHRTLCFVFDISPQTSGQPPQSHCNDLIKLHKPFHALFIQIPSQDTPHSTPSPHNSSPPAPKNTTNEMGAPGNDAWDPQLGPPYQLEGPSPNCVRDSSAKSWRLIKTTEVCACHNRITRSIPSRFNYTDKICTPPSKPPTTPPLQVPFDLFDRRGALSDPVYFTPMEY